jgi:hypothetical protein
MKKRTQPSEKSGKEVEINGENRQKPTKICREEKTRPIIFWNLPKPGGSSEETKRLRPLDGLAHHYEQVVRGVPVSYAFSSPQKKSYAFSLFSLYDSGLYGFFGLYGIDTSVNMV